MESAIETLRNTYKYRGLLLMALPAIILIFMFEYMPMFGLMTAFKNFNYNDGVFGSPWVGLDNFKLLIASSDTMWRILRNTIGYWAVFTIIGTIFNVGLAILINESRFKLFAKISHTMMILPTFISWIAVTYIVTALLHGQYGMINNILAQFSIPPIQWYASPEHWPIILVLVNLWKMTGYGAIIYLSALAGIDQELYEAAEVDGATRWQQIKGITLPMLVPMISIMTLMALGSLMISNTGLFYQVTKNVGILYSTTQTIDAYVLNALTDGSTQFGMTAAVTLFQSVIGCMLVLFTNFIVRRWEPDNALF